MITIDSDNYGAHGIETLFFPGGEPHAKIPAGLEGDVLLFLKPRTWNDVGIGACVIDALTRKPSVGRLEVFAPYFPGARQDRSDGLAPYTAFLMSRLLASRARVTVFDLHSEATYFIGDIAAALMPHDLTVPLLDDVVGIIAPDDGALNRASDFQMFFYPQAELIRCLKKRDPATGQLSGYHMGKLRKVGAYIIVDDICDGGGTFNLLADTFGADPVGKNSLLSMFVSHGIFSKGLDAIDPRIRHIMTTDSWCNLPKSPRLTVLPLFPAFKAHIGV